MGEVFEATDPEPIEHVLGDAYAKMRIRPGTRGAMRMTRTPVSPARLDQFRFTMDLDAGVDPLGVLVFGHLISGRVLFESDRNERHFVPGSVFLVAQPEHPYTAALRDFEIENAVLDPTMPSQVRRRLPARLRHQSRPDPAPRLSSAGAGHADRRRRRSVNHGPEGSFSLLSAFASTVAGYD